MDKNKFTSVFITIIAILLIGIAGYFIVNKKLSSNNVKGAPVVSTEVRKYVEYTNDQYSFNISLPASWEGYSVVAENWAGTMIDDANAPSFTGPKLLIRHPLWTEATPRQDIPIMIFTPAEWNLVLAEKLSLGAAPIGPSELGRNAKYIFALPARYNFAYLPGFEEVEQILANKSFHAF